MKKQNKRNQFTRMALALLLILSMLGNTLIFPTVAQETVAPVDNTTSSETPSADEATTDAISTPTLPEPILLTAADIPEFISAAALTERGAVERMRSEETNMSSVIFRNSDGTRTMYMYGLPVKYTSADGTVRDKSTNLVSVSTASVLLSDQPVAQTMAQMSLAQQEALQAELGILDVERAADTLHMLSTALTARQRSLSDMAYTTLDNDVYALFPTNLAKGMTLVFGEHSVRMTPAGTGMTVTAGGNVTKTTTSSLSDADVTERLLYPNVFGLGTAVQYTPTLTGVKEEILLSRNVGKNSFAFLLETGGLVLTEQNGQFVLIDPETEQQVGKLGEIIVFDSAGRVVRGSMTAQTILAGQKYGITISVDAAFLASATYPVSIDPTVTINPFNQIDDNLIEDVSIYDDINAQNYTFIEYHQIGQVLDTPYQGQAAYRFPVLYDSSLFDDYSSLQANQISAFTLHVKSTSSTTSNAGVEARFYTSTWQNSWKIFGDEYYDRFDSSIDNVSYQLAYPNQIVDIDLTFAARAWLDDVHNLSDEHAYFPETGVLLRNSGNIGVIWLESVEYSLNVYVTMDFTYSVAEDFYFNNFSTRTFLAGNSTTGMLNLQSGLVANIGSAITWKCIYQGNEKYTLQPNGMTNVYLDHNGNYVTTKSDSTLWIYSTSTGIGGVKWIARGTGYEYVLAVNNSGNVVIGSPSNFTAKQSAWRMVAADDYDEAVVIQSELIGMWLAPNEEYDYFNNLVLGDWHFVSKEDFEYTVYNTTAAVFNGSKLTGVSPNSSTTISVKHLPTGLSVLNSLYTASIPEGTYFLKNRQTSDYARVKNGTMTNGQSVVQYDFDESLGEERWIFTLNAATGYYSIKSANSSSTNYYMAVSDDSSALDQPIVIRSATESTLTDGMKWKVATTSNGAYKIIPKTGEGSDYVLATSTSLGTNNAKLLQGDYLDNNSYRDEWYLIQDYAHVYIGDRSGDPLMPPILTTVEGSFKNHGWYGYASTEATKDEFISLLKSSRIISCITHGEAVGIYLSDEVLFSLADINAIDDDDLDSLTLVYYGACLTGMGNDNLNNFVNATSNKGVDVVVGFSINVLIDETNVWSEAFMCAIAAGQSVENAIVYADNFVASHYVTGGRSEYTTSSRYTKGDLSMVPCPEY